MDRLSKKEQAAREFGMELAKRLEEYIMKADHAAFIRAHGFPLSEGHAVKAASDYLAYRATNYWHIGADDVKRPWGET